MTNNTPSNGINERLDRIEALLERVATFAQDECIQRVDADNELRDAIAITNQTVNRMAQRMDGFSGDVRSLTAAVDQLQATVMLS